MKPERCVFKRKGQEGRHGRERDLRPWRQCDCYARRASKGLNTSSHAVWLSAPRPDDDDDGGFDGARGAGAVS